jgi:hypothetical protein
MAIDTSIYNNVRPFTMADPYESAGKALALRAMQKKYTIEDDIAQAGSESGGDPERMAQALLAKGHYQPAIQLRSQAATLAKEQRLAGNAEVERKLKLAEAAGSDAVALDAAWRQTLQAAGGNPQTALAQIQPIYGQIRAKWAQMGHNLPEQFDPEANFASIGQAKESVQYLKTLAPENKPTELARLIAERNALPEGHPDRPKYDETIKAYKAGRGDTNVNVTANTGPMLPGKAGATRIDEGLLDQTQGLMRLDAIQSQFKPEYQTLATRGGNWWTAAKETLGAKLNNKEKKDLEDFSKYRRNAIDSLNQYIKSVTGAAMSEAEAQRILKGMPNPGQGLFDGDSPTEFKAKLDDAISQTKRAIARSAYLKRQGMSLEDGLGKGVSLDSMPQIINERGKAIEAELKKSGVTGKPLERAIRRQLGVEFGLVSD